MISWERILPRGYCVRRLRLLGSTQTASQGLKVQSFAALPVGKLLGFFQGLRAPVNSAARIEGRHARRILRPMEIWPYIPSDSLARLEGPLIGVRFGDCIKPHPVHSRRM